MSGDRQFTDSFLPCANIRCRLPICEIGAGEAEDEYSAAETVTPFYVQSSDGDSTGLRSMTGAPSMASIGPTFSRFPATSRTITRCQQAETGKTELQALTRRWLSRCHSPKISEWLLLEVPMHLWLANAASYWP